MPRVSRTRKPTPASVLINSVRTELEKAGDRDVGKLPPEKQQAGKKNYAEAFSRELALRFANALRGSFPDILPDKDGKGQESRARTAKGYKKLDVNYSTPQLGLGLGVSIKTINFRDPKSKRYTKNYTRVDGELRAEASDYHVRQPYATMVAVIFLPLDACDDTAPSSFGQAVQLFRPRSGRDEPVDDPNLFERVYIGLYDVREDTLGEVFFFDVRDPPPKSGVPKKKLDFKALIDAIVKSFDDRNDPPFEWEEGDIEEHVLTVEDIGEDDPED